MKKARRTPRVIETAGSVFFDLFDQAEAQRLAIQSGLALALEREIAARQWTQAEAARRLGITQPRISNLRRRRLDKFSIDALIMYLARIGVPVRIDTSTPKRRRRGQPAKPATITAAEFDRKFDAGEDVDEYLDWSRARRPGLEAPRLNIDVPIAGAKSRKKATGKRRRA